MVTKRESNKTWSRSGNWSDTRSFLQLPVVYQVKQQHCGAEKKHDVKAPPPGHPHLHSRHSKNIPASSAASTDTRHAVWVIGILFRRVLFVDREQTSAIYLLNGLVCLMGNIYNFNTLKLTQGLTNPGDYRHHYSTYLNMETQ